MHPEDKGRVYRVQGVGVIADVGAIGGAYLYQMGSALAQHVRDAEPTPDLYQLPPRGDYFVPASKCRQNEEYCPSVIVHQQSSLRAGELT